MLNASLETKLARVSNAVAAGTTDINSAGVDMQGFNAALFVVAFGAITAAAVTSVKVQASDDDGVADAYSDLEGTSIAVADDDDNGLVYLDVIHPRKRWLRCVVDRGTQNAVVDAIICQQYGPKAIPTSHPATVAGETHISPDEGTA